MRREIRQEYPHRKTGIRIPGNAPSLPWSGLALLGSFDRFEEESARRSHRYGATPIHRRWPTRYSERQWRVRRRRARWLCLQSGCLRKTSMLCQARDCLSVGSRRYLPWRGCLRHPWPRHKPSSSPVLASTYSRRPYSGYRSEKPLPRPGYSNWERKHFPKSGNQRLHSRQWHRTQRRQYSLQWSRLHH